MFRHHFTANPSSFNPLRDTYPAPEDCLHSTAASLAKNNNNGEFPCT